MKMAFDITIVYVRPDGDYRQINLAEFMFGLAQNKYEYTGEIVESFNDRPILFITDKKPA